jgi:curved DNA-binding protein CbpA
MAGSPDPYATLGVDPSASEVELRTAYRRAVQRHHPDHNNGSPESARRFEEVQEAYAEIRRRRAAGSGPAPRRSAPGPPPTGAGARPADPDLEARLAAMESELKAARDARERAARAAREAQEQVLRAARASSSTAQGRRDRPTDEELGYYSTEDSFSKILDDAAAVLSDRWSEARRSPAAHRVSDLIDDLAGKLTGESHKRD